MYSQPKKNCQDFLIIKLYHYPNIPTYMLLLLTEEIQLPANMF